MTCKKHKPEIRNEQHAIDVGPVARDIYCRVCGILIQQQIRSGELWVLRKEPKQSVEAAK